MPDPGLWDPRRKWASDQGTTDQSVRRWERQARINPEDIRRINGRVYIRRGAKPKTDAELLAEETA